MKRILFLAVLVLAVSAVPAKADSIGPNCGSGECLGSIYTLTFNPSPISQSGGNSTFLAQLSVSTSGFTGGSGFLFAVALGQPSGFVSASLVGAPGGTADWTTVQVAGLSSGGCSNSGNFFCVQLTGNGITTPPTAVPGGTYTFTFDVTVMGTTFDTASDVKAAYNTAADGTGSNLGLTSASITAQSAPPVPEPGTLALFGSGLLGIAGLIRRKLTS